MRLVHNLCLFADKQVVKLQEAPDNVPEGETPHTVSVIAYDALVDVAKPGDRVLVTGILRVRFVVVQTGEREGGRDRADAALIRTG